MSSYDYDRRYSHDERMARRPKKTRIKKLENYLKKFQLEKTNKYYKRIDRK